MLELVKYKVTSMIFIDLDSVTERHTTATDRQDDSDNTMFSSLIILYTFKHPQRDYGLKILSLFKIVYSGRVILITDWYYLNLYYQQLIVKH